MSKSFRMWIYHETEDPMVIESDSYDEYKESGWTDSPARLIKLETLGIDKDKVDAGDAQESSKAQQAMDAVEGVKESLNGALNLELMNKDELEDYAIEHFSIDLDKRKSKAKLIAKIKEHIEAE